MSFFDKGTFDALSERQKGCPTPSRQTVLDCTANTGKLKSVSRATHGRLLVIFVSNSLGDESLGNIQCERYYFLDLLALMPTFSFVSSFSLPIIFFPCFSFSIFFSC